MQASNGAMTVEETTAHHGRLQQDRPLENPGATYGSELDCWILHLKLCV